MSNKIPDDIVKMKNSFGVFQLKSTCVESAVRIQFNCMLQMVAFSLSDKWFRDSIIYTATFQLEGSVGNHQNLAGTKGARSHFVNIHIKKKSHAQN